MSHARIINEMCGRVAGLGLDLGGAFEEKMTYNAIREDHTHAARKLATGKKY